MAATRWFVSVLALLSMAACDVSQDNAEQANAAQQTTERGGAATEVQADAAAVERARALARSGDTEQVRRQMRAQANTEMRDLRFVVDQGDRKLEVFRGGQLVGTYDVSVGMPDHPTPVGQFEIERVDLNPRWIPPDSEWAEDRQPRAPGDPQNPMGRARLVYMMPYTIHGTDDLDSLGGAESHGSIRVANEHVVTLAEMLLKAGNSWEGPNWFNSMIQNRTEEYQVPLERPVPLTIRE